MASWPDELDNLPFCYRGYVSGDVTRDSDGVYHGTVAGFPGLTYSGRTRDELSQAFRRVCDAAATARLEGDDATRFLDRLERESEPNAAMKSLMADYDKSLDE